MLSESANRQTHVFVAITTQMLLTGFRLTTLVCMCIYIVFSFCVYADAVKIPVPSILQMDNCKRLWYFCLQVFR